MRSYVKIYGPPVMKAIKALEKVAIDMPQVCIMDTTLHFRVAYMPPKAVGDDVADYFHPDQVPEERCNTIISKSHEALGEYDFFFEWFKDPSAEECQMLIEKIDEALAPLGCRYTITTK